jgi:hypothetical protein
MYDDIKVVRLQTGEEMIARVKISKNNITLTKPAVILPAGEGRIGLAPYLPYCEFEDMELQKCHVIFMLDPVDEFKDQYVQSFISNIVIPDAMTSAAINSAPRGEDSSLRLVTD